jgi:pyruvate dehydrogenase E2 component (dihydrolipoamide acetyltransferase)
VPIEILMPALSPTMTEGNLAKWLKQEGDLVKPGDVIAEIETDKATMEVEAVDEGIIGKIMVPAATRGVAVNSLIALLLEEGESSDVLASYTPKINKVEQIEKKQETMIADKPAASSALKPEIKDSGRVKASPLAKRIAQIEKIDLNRIAGTGPHGRIIKQDVIESLSNKKQNILQRNPREYIAIENSNIRRVIAKRLVESKQNIPHFYLSIECNVDKLLNMREDLNLDATEYKISVNDLIIKAVALALRDVPEANSSWTEDAILQYNNVDVAVAVAIEGGLITPIIKNADQKSIIEISNEMKILAKRARENALKPEEFQGGGFSISNLGMYGIKKFQAIINPPQSCILAVGTSSKRPIVCDDKIVIANMLDLSLSCDHRVVDGAVGAKFLGALKSYIERPLKMML